MDVLARWLMLYGSVVVVVVVDDQTSKTCKHLEMLNLANSTTLAFATLFLVLPLHFILYDFIIIINVLSHWHTPVEWRLKIIIIISDNEEASGRHERLRLTLEAQNVLVSGGIAKVFHAPCSSLSANLKLANTLKSATFPRSFQKCCSSSWIRVMCSQMCHHKSYLIIFCPHLSWRRSQEQFLLRRH